MLSPVFPLPGTSTARYLIICTYPKFRNIVFIFEASPLNFTQTPNLALSTVAAPLLFFLQHLACSYVHS